MVFRPQIWKMCKSQVFGTGLESFERNLDFWNFKFSTSYLRKTTHFGTFSTFSRLKNSKIIFDTRFRKTTPDLLQNCQNTFLNLKPVRKNIFFQLRALIKSDFWNPGFEKSNLLRLYFGKICWGIFSGVE